MMSERDHVLKDPPHLRLIFLSLLIAYMIELLPYQGIALYLKPHWVLLVLAHWWLRDPWRVGQGTGFVMGLLMDIAMTGTLGLSAFCYSLSAFLAVKFRPRLLGFSPAAQGVQMIPMFLGVRFLMTLFALLTGGDQASWLYLLGTFLDLAAWIPITLVLHFQDLKRAYRTP